MVRLALGALLTIALAACTATPIHLPWGDGGADFDPNLGLDSGADGAVGGGDAGGDLIPTPVVDATQSGDALEDVECVDCNGDGAIGDLGGDGATDATGEGVSTDADQTDADQTDADPALDGGSDGLVALEGGIEG